MHLREDLRQIAGQLPRLVHRHPSAVAQRQLGGPLVQALPVDQVFHKEDVPGGLEHLARRGRQPERGECFQDVRLVAQPVPGVAPVEPGADVRARLLHEHFLAGPLVFGPVDTAAVGVPDRLADDITSGKEYRLGLPDGHAVLERRRRPGGRGEPRVAFVRDEGAVRRAQTSLVEPFVVEFARGGEAAVAVVHQTFRAIPAIGQDGRTGQPEGRLVQPLGQFTQLIVIVGIDGDELARLGTRCAYSGQFGQNFRRNGEFERAGVLGEDGHSAFEYLRRRGHGRRDVQLPALPPGNVPPGPDHAPDFAVFQRPVLVQRPLGDRRIVHRGHFGCRDGNPHSKTPSRA